MSDMLQISSVCFCHIYELLKWSSYVSCQSKWVTLECFNCQLHSGTTNHDDIETKLFHDDYMNGLIAGSHFTNKV